MTQRNGRQDAETPPPVRGDGAQRGGTDRAASMWEELEDVERFAAMSAARRRRLVTEVVQQLGEGWTAVDRGPHDAVAVQYRGLAFVVVPGGAFEMGLRDDDLGALGELVSDQLVASVLEDAAGMRPVHRVVVHPFVVSCAPLGWEDVERLSRGEHSGRYCYFLSREAAGALARSVGFRLPSEAELEWLARDGDRFHFALDGARRHEEVGGDSRLLDSRFGIVDIFERQWMEDDFHPTYEGAPSTSEPWHGGEDRGHVRSWGPPEMIESPEQVVSLLAAARGWTPNTAGVRLARRLGPSRS